MKPKGVMSDRVEHWLKIAPMPDVKIWLKSLYVDNILAVSKGGENTASAFAEYGKKLMVDTILAEHSAVKSGRPESAPVEAGVELLGVLTTKG